MEKVKFTGMLDKFSALLACTFSLIMVVCSACSHKEVARTENKVSPVNENPKVAKLWKDSGTAANALTCPGKVFPLSYRILEVDTAGVRRYLVVQGKQPGVITRDTTIIDIPLPDGTFEPFAIYQVQVMAPELAAKYPYLKTYAGSSKLYPADQIRLEVNPEGIQAMILSTRGTILLGPFCKDDKLHMISYFRKNLPEGIKEDFEVK